MDYIKITTINSKCNNQHYRIVLQIQHQDNCYLACTSSLYIVSIIPIMESIIRELDNPLRFWSHLLLVRPNSIIIHLIITARIFNNILEHVDDLHYLLARDRCSLGANSVRAYCSRLQLISRSIVPGLLYHLQRIDRAGLRRINKLQSLITMALNQK